MRNPHPARPLHSPGNRWELVWSHREELLEIARRRSSSDEEAEDAVHEAMIRAVEDPDVQYGRVRPWLRLATVRACAERDRQVARDSELARSLPAAPVDPCQVEEAACDRAEARWLADRSMELLPARQAEALRLRSQDLDVGQVARTLGLSYRATESLLARARRSLRDALAGSLAVAMTIWLGVRRFPGTGTTRSAVTTSAATVAVAGLLLPAPSPGLPDSRPPRAGAPPAAPAEDLPAPRTKPHPAHAPSASPAPAPESDARTDVDTARPVAGKPQTPYEPPDMATLHIRVGSVSLTTELPPRAVATSIPSLPVNTTGAYSTEALVELPEITTGESGGRPDPPSPTDLDVLGE